MSIPIITVCSHPEHAKRLIDSATKRGWSVVCLQVDWRGFGTKIIETYNYLKQHPDITEFVFCDAYDVICLGDTEEFLMKMQAYGFTSGLVASAERGLWPPHMEVYRDKYPSFEHGFNFINSGCYYAKSETFIELVKNCPPDYSSDDQEWLNMWFLRGADIQIDHEQVLFNSHSFIRDGEYTGYYDPNFEEPRPRIKVLGNSPCFVHFNGRTVDEDFNRLYEKAKI